MPDSHREEVLNIELARILNSRGLIAAPETILTISTGSRRLPDVLVNYRGLRVSIEGKIGDFSGAAEAVSQAAQQRVDEGVAHIGIAVLYPAGLRRTSFRDLPRALSEVQLSLRAFNEAGAGDWHSGDVQVLDEQLRRSHEQLVQENVVDQALGILNQGITAASQSIQDLPTGPVRMIELLGIGEPPANAKGNRAKTAAQIAALVLANALIFHEELAAYDDRVRSLAQFAVPGLCDALIKHWSYIVADINYAPIFLMARDILRALPSHIDIAIQELASCARNIVSLRAALRHDLMGRIYHRLLIEAKYLGTYYTAVSSATLLLKLALGLNGAEVDWVSLEQISGFKIGDLACGTGTLLMAAVEAVRDNHVQASVDLHKAPRISELHRTLAENSLWGCDVIASAVHLTASTLALLAPDVSFHGMHLYSLPLGGAGLRMGSLDYLTDLVQSDPDNPGWKFLPIQVALFGTESPSAEKITGSGQGTTETWAEMPPLDLCVMNPPFTRSVGGNLLFGSLPQSERTGLQTRLRTLLRQPQILAQGTAGLGPVFVATADRLVKDEGRQALVLPLALLSGVAWKETRDLLSDHYSVEHIVVSHDPERWNFSENTELSEVLLIARKTDRKQAKQGKVVWTKLFRNPTTTVEAISLANSIQRLIRDGNVASLEANGISQIRDEEMTWGEIMTTEKEFYKDNVWWPYCFAQTELIRVASALRQGRVALPGRRMKYDIPTCSLGELGEIGPDRRDIWDGFTCTDTPTSYPGFWGHDSETVLSLEQEPNCHLAPRVTPAEGRPERRVELLWPRAGQLLIGERLWLNTVRFPAVFATQKVLSNVWWPFRVDLEGGQEADIGKILALWLSSTLGLLLLLVSREQTRGPWVDFKKPVLTAMNVLDPRELNGTAKGILMNAYEELARLDWGHLREMASDPVRARLDSAVSEALGLPDITSLREALTREPIISNTRL